MTGKEIYSNRAEFEPADGAAYDCSRCEDHRENLIFAMKDKQHSFSLGLSTVLQCLAVAEREGYVPKLPSDWWNSLRE